MALLVDHPYVEIIHSTFPAAQERGNDGYIDVHVSLFNHDHTYNMLYHGRSGYLEHRYIVFEVLMSRELVHLLV